MLEGASGGLRPTAPQVTVPPDERSAIAVAMAWSYRVMAVSLEMVVPGMLGYVVDRWIGTGFLLAAVGFFGGMSLAIWHLLLMTRGDEKRPSSNEGAEGMKKP